MGTFFRFYRLGKLRYVLKDAESGTAHAGEGRGGVFLRRIYDEESLRRRGR
ncbi:hypothetical protein HMPREF1986_02132 [Oribacterium sp. oral taxon 078 str. F0263]|nr:hypothetical protein HMPREF1986_02132 [Oribacterium sp. oral taxon 078 str. F0263]